MSLKLFTRLFVLVSALACTVLAIFWLKQGHMNQFWTSLGVGKNHINWCEERVASLYFYGENAKLYEKDHKWFWLEGEEIPLDYLRVEKWFAKYCQIPFEELSEAPQGQLEMPILEAEFLDQSHLTLFQYEDGHYRLRDRHFRSETLRQALKELLAFKHKIE